MRISDTISVTPVFLESQPDWGKPMLLTASYKTTVATATNGADQRARWRLRPRYSFAYSISALTPAEFTARRSKMIQELGAPVVCPIWTDNYVLTSMSGGNNTANFADTLTQKKFKKDSYAYFIQGSSTYFRKITSVNTTSLTLAADGSAPSFTAGTLVYPCIFGTRPKTKGGFVFNRVNQTDENIFIQEL